MKTISCSAGSTWYILHRDDAVYIRDHNGKWMRTSGINFTPEDDYSNFSLKPGEPVLASHEYKGKLDIGLSLKSLKLKNTLILRPI